MTKQNNTKQGREAYGRTKDGTFTDIKIVLNGA